MSFHIRRIQTLRLARLAALTAVVTGCTLVAAPDKESCPDEFDCVVITAPLNHFDPSDDRTIDVVFAVRPAPEERQGVLVTAVGGPGASGIEAIEYRLPELSRRIADHFDLVYFDQRGIRDIPSPACPQADAEFSESYLELPTEDDERWAGLKEINRHYAASCVLESPNREILPHLGTEQVVGDLELFREQQGYDRLIIYGESYGTSVAQAYATAFPDRVERLVLDGPIDRTRDTLEMIAEQVAATQQVLELVFSACDVDMRCAADMGMPASQAYAAQIAQLTDRPQTVRFPVEPDVFEDWPLPAEDLAYIAFSRVYYEEDRVDFLRALAYATRGDYVPVLRLWGLSGEGLSSMVLQAVGCLDGSIPGGDRETEARLIEESRAATAQQHRWFYEFALGCLDWPDIDRDRAPAPAFTADGIPTLIVASVADPVTPYSAALSLLDQLDDGQLITVGGGGHVMFGTGNSCVDRAVTRFITAGVSVADLTCDAEVIVPYMPIMPEEGDWDELLTGLDTDLFYLPELYFWDGYERTVVACAHGGAITFTGTDATTEFSLERCAVRPGMVISGEGSWDFSSGRSHMEVTVENDPCTYRFAQDWEQDVGVVEPRCA